MRKPSSPPEGWQEFAHDIGIRVQRRRAELGLSQERVAYEANLSRWVYQQLEKGESRPGNPADPRLRTLLAVAQVLNLRLDELLPIKIPDLTAR